MDISIIYPGLLSLGMLYGYKHNLFRTITIVYSHVQLLIGYEPSAQAAPGWPWIDGYKYPC